MADEVKSWFKQLPGKIQREMASDMRSIADELADLIRSAAPVKTGNLRESIKVIRGRKTLELFVVAGGDNTQKEARRGSGVVYDYALSQEFGTSRMPANPFFYSTYREHRDEFAKKIEDAVSRAIEKA